MREKINNTVHIRRFLAGLLLLIFASYYANTSLFLHCHVIDGVTIVHSHFHSHTHTSSDTQDGAASREHTQSELAFINVISNYTAETQLVITFAIALVVGCEWIYSNGNTTITKHVNAAHPQLRAPPMAL